MPLFINTNVPSLTVQRHMSNGSEQLNKVYARLASGLRINTAVDDAAGLGVSNRMTAQVRGLNQAIRNANDGISVTQVAEGALAESSNMLQRISELTVQAANATNKPEDRQSIQDEIGQLLSEIDRVAKETEFNGWTVLDGTQSPLIFQVGAKEGQTVVVDLANARASTLLAQPVLADPSAPKSVNNPAIEGITISAASPALPGSKLFSSKQAAMINAVANADIYGASPATILKEHVGSNMALVVGADESLVASLHATEDPGIGDVTLESMVGDASVLEWLAPKPTVETVVDALGGNVDIINAGIVARQDFMTIARALNETPASEMPSLDDRIVVAAGLAAAGLSTDGVTKIAGGGSREAAIAAMIAMKHLDGVDPAFENDKDKARVLAAALYAANRNYSTGTDSGGPGADGVPGVYEKLAGAENGAIYNARFFADDVENNTDTSNVVDKAVKDGTDVEDVPVGNILSVIKAFDRAINENKDIDTIARLAFESDKGGLLTMEEAKIIAAAGVVAARQGNTVSMARDAAVNMSLVLAARDAAAAAASAPAGGEKVTVPAWMINVDGQNSFPPSPLVDVTGRSVPTDPTLEFDPPHTDAGGTKPYNPPLSGQLSSSRSLAVILNGINSVSSTRGALGAIEGRFGSNIANLSNVVENVTAARSRILDADVAAETANLTKLSILQQAGTAILAQANQLPQLALKLLNF